MSKEGAYIDFPFGDTPVCVKYDNRIFAEIYPGKDNFRITVRCEPETGEYYRAKYPEIVMPGYHVPLRQRKYKNTILIREELEFQFIAELIDQSYDTLIKKSHRI